MPGTKDAKAPSQWFKKAFGFREASFEETRRNFSFADGTLRLNGSDRSFYVGPFDTISLEDLQARLARNEDSEKTQRDLGTLSFRNVRDTTFDLHLAPENAGAVFQVASLFNCLELESPDTSPEAGVTKGGCQPTQGSACASACPAAAVFRNYFVNGEGQIAGRHVDCLSEVSQYVNNRRVNYWAMRNGFCMPARDFKKINERFINELGFDDDIRRKMQVGIHWDTEVAGGAHRVTQIFCSAAPVSLSKFVRAEEWEPFARCILDAQFEAVLAAAACMARDRNERVRVFLTPVGGGLLGNRVKWIASAIERALTLHQAAPLDVHLVHLNYPMSAYKDLEKELWTPKRQARRTITEDMSRIYGELDDLKDAEEEAKEEDKNVESARRIARAFEFFDLNGDGVIDRTEFMDILLMLDSYFFQHVNR